MEYTKGQWKVYTDELCANEFAIDLDHYPHEKTHREIAVAFKKDDAQLIAAAPAMYEALKELVTIFDSPTGRVSFKERDRAFAALKQAEGK